MILYCTNCSAKFKVDPKLLGDNGRTVRCSSCEHEWFQKPESIADTTTEESANNDKQESADKPIKKKISPKKELPEVLPHYRRTGLRILLKLFFIISLFAFLFVGLIANKSYILEKAPYTDKVYKILELENYDGLQFTKVDCTVSDTPSSSRFLELDIDISIQNTADKTLKLRNVRFTVFSKDNTELGNFSMELNKDLNPTEKEVIEGRLDSIPANAAYVVIEIGNDIDLFVRKTSFIK